MDTENLKRLKEVLDAADDKERLTTRLKMQEEITELQRRVAHYQLMLEQRDSDRQALREEIEAYQRVQVGMNNEREETWRLLDRTKVYLGGPLLVVTYAAFVYSGMRILQWADMATSSPMAFIGMLVVACVATIASMIALEGVIER